MVGITIALVAGLAAGLIAGSFKTAMALLKPVITILLAIPAANYLGRDGIILVWLWQS